MLKQKRRENEKKSEINIICIMYYAQYHINAVRCWCERYSTNEHTYINFHSDLWSDTRNSCVPCTNKENEEQEWKKKINEKQDNGIQHLLYQSNNKNRNDKIKFLSW